jgi:hypothetical protein
MPCLHKYRNRDGSYVPIRTGGALVPETWLNCPENIIPIVEEPDHETSFQDWLAQLEEEEDFVKLSELAEDIGKNIKSLSQTNTP